MKFVYNIHVLIIILTNCAEFTPEELTHISQELSPIECMRLLEAIYLAIPNGNEHRVDRETPLNTWITQQTCLNELKVWNHQFPDKTDPKAHVVMIQHLNALGRTDLANYVRKNRETLPVFSNVVQFGKNEDVNYQENRKILKDRILKRATKEKGTQHYSYPKRISHAGLKRGKIPRRTNQYNENIIHHSMVSAIISGGPVIDGQAGVPSKSQSGKWKYGISRNSLFLIIALGIVVIFICGIVFLIFRRLLKNSSCSGERSDLISPRNNTCTAEKGQQCIHCFDDHDHDQDDYETQSNFASQISEIDVEGGSCFNSAGVESRKSFSDAISFRERIITPRVSIEKLKLCNDEPNIHKILKESLPPNSCRCRPLESKICGTKPKKKKKKTKVKCNKEGTRTSPKNYLKAMQDKILPRQHRQSKKDCNFESKQLQEKILNILNQECGACQCCNCTSHWQVNGSKDIANNRSARDEERPTKSEREESPKKEHPKREKHEKLSIVDKEVVTYQTSVTSRSPMSGRRSSRRQESDSGQKSNRKMRKKDKSEKPGPFRMKKVKEKRVVSSLSSETDDDDNEKRRKFKSKRSKRLQDSSLNTLLSAHDKPKRFF